MRKVTILGGGLAGLTAAINLKYAGFDVEVHERKRFCGKPTHDFQFLENWTFKDDALKMARNVNIQTDFYIKPVYSLELISPSLKRCPKKSSQPFMYLLKRGPVDGSIDRALQQQARKAGIPLFFKSKLKAEQADIIATGKRDPTFLATGITFPFDHPDSILILFNDRISFKIYSYFVVNDGVGQIVSINPVGSTAHRVRLDRAVNKFEEILGFKLATITHRFAAPASLYFLKNARLNKQYYIGEAAGFQDCLAGFGMMYAFKSGYHAADSIIRNDDYQRLWQADMLKPMKVSRTNRLLFERLSNTGYENLVKMLSIRNTAVVKLFGGDDLRDILNKLYNHSLPYALWPLIFCKSLTPFYRFLFNLARGARR